jgi:hypothetical protein
MIAVSGHYLARMKAGFSEVEDRRIGYGPVIASLTIGIIIILGEFIIFGIKENPF